MMPPDPQVIVLPRPRLKMPTSPSGAKLLALVFRPHRLGGVLDHDDAAAAAHGPNRRDVRRDPEQMVRHHAERVRAQRLLEAGVIEIERRRIDVAEHWPQSGFEHGRGNRGAGVGRNHDLGPIGRAIATPSASASARPFPTTPGTRGSRRSAGGSLPRTSRSHARARASRRPRARDPSSAGAPPPAAGCGRFS